MKISLPNVSSQCQNRGTAASHDAAQSWADHVCVDGLLHGILPLPPRSSSLEFQTSRLDETLPQSLYVFEEQGKVFFMWKSESG